MPKGMQKHASTHVRAVATNNHLNRDVSLWASEDISNCSHDEPTLRVSPSLNIMFNLLWFWRDISNCTDDESTMEDVTLTVRGHGLCHGLDHEV